MKKFIALLAVTAMCLAALTGCGGDEPTSTPPSTTTTTASTDTPDSSSEPSEPAEVEPEYYNQDVYITNSTGVAIVELYLSPSDSDDWGSDLLGGESFAAGETVLFEAGVVGTADATWDILVVDEDGDEITFADVNLSSATALDLNWGADGQTPTVLITESGDEQYYSQDLDITNGTGVAIIEMYISPSDDENWGENMLEGSTFPADETMHFSTELIGTADATWDIKIVDEDGDEVVFEGISFSSSVELLLHWGEDGASPTVTML